MASIPLWKAVCLGVVQGITEFLPVSSSAHLVIVQQYLGLGREGAFLMALDVALHFGTLTALLVIFYRDLLAIVQTKAGLRLGLYLMIATIPAAILGFTFKGFFELFFADIIPASFFLLITGWILWLTKKAKPPVVSLSDIKPSHAWLIGLAQAVAIFPGISRSGATIAAGLLLRFKPEDAVRFSFLLAIPAIAGATVLESRQFAQFELPILLPVLAGTLVAFGTGYLAIRWMLKWVAKHPLSQFAWYCWVVGGITLMKELFF